MRRQWIVTLAFVVLMVGSRVVAAQEHPTVVTLVTPDSVQPQPIANTLSEEMHSPRKALFLSFLPGAGQVYNGQAWKVPIIYGGFAAAGYFIYYNYNKMVDFRDEYLWRIKGGEPQLEGYTNYPDNSIYNYYQSYNQSFQLAIIFSVIIYSLNLVDAFVYGHLYEFQINDDISMSLHPNVQPLPLGTSSFPMTSLSCTFTF
ncbi:MAG: hypothetical protein IJT39_05670 [Bacteroidales bacterium]|nr:hypothetical protein [Bacteroidales bacterium]